MTDTLVISVRFLDGRYHGQGAWPPEPARLFQALVAGTALGARLSNDARSALAWLETLAPPVIAAPAARKARAVKLWVPNNDADAKLGTAKGGYAEAVAAVRTAKEEQPWLFDETQPLLYVWTLPDGATLPAGLDDVVHSLYRLGRGIDPAFAVLEHCTEAESGAILDSYPGAIHRPGPGDSHGVPCRGTLDSLILRHESFTGRFARAGKKLAFSQPPRPRLRLIGYDTPPRRVLYHLRRNVSGEFMPLPLTEAAEVTDRVLRQAALRLSEAYPDRAALITRVLVGAAKASNQDKTSRARLLPLPSSGHEHTDPSIRRLLLEVPAGCSVSVQDLDWAFGTLSPYDPETGELLGWRLERASERDIVLGHYTARVRRWRTLTPMVLPVLRERGGEGRDRRNAVEQMSLSVRQALRHAGLRIEPSEIRVQPEPFRRRGARADAFAAPDRLKGAACAHVELVFSSPVAGPLILGNGRFRGLGLFEPVTERRDLLLFALAGPPNPDAEAVSQAARRAIMARMRDHLRRRDLPAFFTGHDHNGSPVRKGGRSHLAVLVDPEAGQLLVATPQALDHRDPQGQEARHTYELAAALDGFERLVAGSAGAFSLSPLPDGAAALTSVSRVWQSVTDWTPCRYGKGDPVRWLAEDVRQECRRRGLPEPEVDVLEIRQGRQKGIRARLRLRFAVTVAGPMALGQSAMKGGGVFVAVE